MDVATIVLRVLHIGGGIFWAGSAFFFFQFIEPTAVALGPAAGPFVHHMVAVRRLVAAVLGASAVTVAAGAILFWRVSNGLDPEWLASGMGRGLTFGAIAALIAFVLGLVTIAPNVNRLDRLGGQIAAAGRPPTPEEMARMHGLQTLLHRASSADVVLLSLAILGMAAARYLPS
ncbi:hypothetical protein BH18CHL2_BH18CHL2_09960 [soil metagenome]